MADIDRTQIADSTTEVDVTPAKKDDGETVSLRFGDLTIVGSRFDVHRLVLEADRQLGQMAYRFVS